VSREQLRQVEQDPVVRRALDLFDGTIVHVEQRVPATSRGQTE
jgi:hypothetical protein